MSDTIIIKNVRYKYPRGEFCLNCDEFTLKKGEVCLVEGKNGSGKTTLLKLCTGILRAEGATLDVFGEDMTKSSLGSIGKHVGYLFQEPSRQIFCATVWDEMTFARAMLGENKEDISKKAVDLLGRFGLKSLARRGTQRLSRGEKQRLAIAAILMHDIGFLMLDEPTTGLDADNRSNLYGQIRALVDSGVGVAIISHDNELLSEFKGCRTVRVEEGKVHEDI